MFRLRTFPIVEKCSIMEQMTMGRENAMAFQERILDLQDKKAELLALLD